MMLFKLLFFSIFLPFCLAWGSVGHEIVATIAQTNLHPKVRSYLCQILPEFTSYLTPRGEKHCHLAPLAAWPDNVRFRFPWSGHLHYVNPVDDYPPKHCTFGENGWTSEENVLTALTNYTSRVVTSTGYDRDVALRFLVHFVGDLHQPLHLTGRNRGGNDVKVHFEGRLNKLHSVWDSQIINKQLRELSNYTTKLPSYRIESALQNKPYDSYIRWILKEGLGQPASNDVDSWWDQEEIEDWLKCPDQEKVEGWGSANQFVMGLKDFVGIKSLTDNVDKTDLPICPLHWSRKMHPLVCSYAFASPVPIDENIPPYPELDVPEYLGRIDSDKVIQKQLAMGGIRLASILNSLLLEEALAFSSSSTSS